MKADELFFNDYHVLSKKNRFSSRILDIAKFNTNELIKQYNYLNSTKELKWKKL